LCLDFLSTASPVGYSSVVNVQNFTFEPCSAVGNIRRPANVSASTTATTSSSMSFIGGASTQTLPTSAAATSESNTVSAILATATSGSVVKAVGLDALF
jgi:hypothetical protein